MCPRVGSEASSSTGSSGSLSRGHGPLQGAAPSPAGRVSFPGGDLGAQAGSANYILLPLEAATGIPPGSILLNPHTGECPASALGGRGREGAPASVSGTCHPAF